MASRRWWEIEDPVEQERAYNEGRLQQLGFDPMSDPRYNSLYSNIMAAGGMDLANSREAIQQALIAYGVVPEGWQDSLGSLDERTLELIRKNDAAGLSQNAMMNETFNTDVKDFKGLLSAKGLRRSGAKGAGLRKRKTNFDRAKSGALSKLLGQLRGVYSQYAANQMGRQNALQQAMYQYGENWTTPIESDWSNYDWDNPWDGDDNSNNPGGGDGWGRNDERPPGWKPF